MLNKKAIVLDYGHGGSDSGACANGIIEKKANLVTGKACKVELEKYGITVYETRKEYEYLSIEQRCSIANKTNAAYFCSIHHNAGGGDRGETIHSILGGDSKDMADCIAKELKKAGQGYVKVYNKKGNGNKDYYGVIRGTKMAACIVEVAFLDNIKDVQFVDTIEEQKRNGVAIAHGILDEMDIYVNSNEFKNNSFKNGSYSGKKARVIATELNVRYDRWVNGVAEPKIIGKLKKGDIVDLEHCLNGWTSIKGFKGNKGLGYVNGKYLNLI